ncbi:hypothetical protein AB0M05_47275 [Streptomyces violaceusniger]|uniref:hypothetical protein n=1 Tax=Streptomyces violaceusniger TaxID=68280 RepID=UPI00343D0E2A
MTGWPYPYELAPVEGLSAAQLGGTACVYCPADLAPGPDPAAWVVGWLRGVRVVAHRDCAEQHRIEVAR